MIETNDYLNGFSGIEEALKEKSFPEEDVAEHQLFLTPWQLILRRFVANKLAVSGVIILVIIALFCYIAPLFYGYNATEVFYLDKTTGEELRTFDSDRLTNAILNTLQRPGGNHILGTNKDGQDMLARLMYGGRVSLAVAFVVMFVALLIGVIAGGAAGYYGGVIDMLVMRIVDVISSIPFIPLMLIIAMMLVAFKVPASSKIYYTMFVIGFIYWTSVARIVRGNILSLREMEFMQAARASGIKARNQIFRHLVPNTLPNIIVTATLELGEIILLESTLSFLGVGVGAPYASWGNMVGAISDSIVMRQHINVWMAPGLMILLTVIAFNFVGDGLRDATDPRTKR
jgi:peptide/nickel transport system permease protein